jgi:hypothetical protein
LLLSAPTTTVHLSSGSDPCTGTKYAGTAAAGAPSVARLESYQ